MPAYKARRLATLNANLDKEELNALEGKPSLPDEPEPGMTTI